MKNKHYLTIAGVDLTLNSENSEEYVQKLALELTRRINSILAEDPLFNGAPDGEEYVKELIIK